MEQSLPITKSVSLFGLIPREPFGTIVRFLQISQVLKLIQCSKELKELCETNFYIWMHFNKLYEAVGPKDWVIHPLPLIVQAVKASARIKELAMNEYTFFGDGIYKFKNGFGQLLQKKKAAISQKGQLKIFFGSQSMTISIPRLSYHLDHVFEGSNNMQIVTKIKDPMVVSMTVEDMQNLVDSIGENCTLTFFVGKNRMYTQITNKRVLY